MRNQFRIAKVSDRYSDSIVLPKIIHIENNLYVAAFYVMKLLPAKFMLQEALKKGQLKEQSIIAETSSGSFAFGLATICREMNLPFHIVTDSQMDTYLKRQLESLGGNIHIVKQSPGQGGIQQARLKALSEILDSNPNSFWPCQYDNRDNALAYTIVGELLLDLFGENLTLVGSVGSGGSTCGTIRTLREKNPNAKLIGVDTFNSILFGQEDGPRMLRGLGNSLLPKNLDHTCFDEIHWVSASEAFLATQQLHLKKAMFTGPTTGAAFMVAKWTAEQNPDHPVVFISPDEGHRYIETVYNSTWLQENNLLLDKLPSNPISVTSPTDAKQTWSYMNWDRRSLESVK